MVLQTSKSLTLALYTFAILFYTGYLWLAIVYFQMEVKLVPYIEGSSYKKNVKRMFVYVAMPVLFMVLILIPIMLLEGKFVYIRNSIPLRNINANNSVQKVNLKLSTI